MTSDQRAEAAAVLARSAAGITGAEPDSSLDRAPGYDPAALQDPWIHPDRRITRDPNPPIEGPEEWHFLGIADYADDIGAPNNADLLQDPETEILTVTAGNCVSEKATIPDIEASMTAGTASGTGGGTSSTGRGENISAADRMQALRRRLQN
jgi:hypothetical protein